MDCYPIKVLGSLAANGTSSNTGEIVFTAVNPNNGWNGFDIDGVPSSESVIFNHCIFEHGYADGINEFLSGGAIAVRDFDNIIIDHCVFRNNWADLEMGSFKGSGGAIALDNSSISISNSIFYNNYAKYVGGAIVCYGESDANIDHCLFHHNTSGQDAGAIEIWTSSPTITNCTFSNNMATAWGGAFDIYDFSIPNIVNCIFWGNTASQYNEISIYSSDCTVNLNYSDVEGGQSGMGPYGIGTNGSYDNNIDEDPVFFEPLAWDYNLDLDLSPCIDAGDPNMPDPDGTAPEMGCYYYPQTGIFSTVPNDLQFYPNPVKNNGCIKLDLSEVSKIQIEIFNFAGQKVLAYTPEKQLEGLVSIPVNFSRLPAGSYICKILTNKTTRTTKFIKY